MFLHVIPQTFQKNQNGFTLLEVMIAIAILATTVTMLFGSQSQSLSLITESQFNTQATFLSGLKIAEIESGKEELYNNDGDFGENFAGYRWKLEVDSPSMADFPILEEVSETLEQVDLSITWGDERFVYKVRYFIYKGAQGNTPGGNPGGQGGSQSG